MCIAVRRIFAKIKLIQMSTIFILAVDFIGSDCKQQRNALQYFWILLDESLEVLLDVLRTYKRIEDIQFHLDAVNIAMDFFKINILAIICDAVTETG